MFSEFRVRPTTPLRSANMRAVRCRGNKSTELKLGALLARSGTNGWQMHVSDVAGCHDFFFRAQKVAVFVDGCFWHQCPRCGHTPKTNRPYWSRKLARNKRRDAQVRAALRAEGIRVIRIWECRLRAEPASCMRRLLLALRLPEISPARGP